jgi:predicted lipoprotein
MTNRIQHALAQLDLMAYNPMMREQFVTVSDAFHQLEAEKKALAEQVKRWEDKEVEKATCCWRNEERANALGAVLTKVRTLYVACGWDKLIYPAGIGGAKLLAEMDEALKRTT